jgi:type IV pilus assembly protein PilY1
MGKTQSMFRKAACGGFVTALVLASAPSHATITLADSPLFLTVSVSPNITVTLDDSGSMARAYVPDTCGAGTDDCGTLDNRYVKSSRANPLYYNPNVKYPQGKDAAGNNISTSFTAAKRNGFDSVFGTRNLSNDYRPTSYLDLTVGATTGDERYMGHDDIDFRCRTSTNVCQYSTNNGSSWTNTSRTCSNNNECRGPQGSGNDPAGMPAYYYVYDSSNGSCSSTNTDDDCYDIKIVSATSGPAAVDLNGDGVVNSSDADERQNFANWYSFARTRNLATVTAASLAFEQLDSSVRLAWQALNSCRGSTSSLVDSDCDGWKNNFTSVSNRMQAYSANKTNFYNWLHQLPTGNGGLVFTPLPEAMQRAGEYYRTSGENSPYDNDFTTSASGELTCRRNYHVLMTDGIWNNAISTAGNKDGTAIALPETSADGISQYTPISPYTDTHTNTLADVAFHYWVTDLRSTLSDDLLPSYRDTTGTVEEDFWNPRNDTATWQHMVNFTIGLGLTDFLAQEGLTWDSAGNMYGGSYPSIAAGTTAWPQPGSDDPANVADLWHAAINSRGQFFSADDPYSLSVAFRAALTAITAQSGSSAALSANSTSLTGTTLVYQAKFNADWSGALLALPVESTGPSAGEVGSFVWDASTLLPAHGSRNIFTHNGTAGLAFTSCASLSAAQKLALDTNSGGVVDNWCSQRLAWLRGDPKDEVRTVGGLRRFRNRPTTVMGDIINSDPAYVKDVDYGYTGLPTTIAGQSTYDAYRLANGSRTPMVYVGSNDGRMYGIRGDTGAVDSGVEKFSYIPSGVYPNLSHLTDPSYVHRYYVDGSITAGDAHFGGGWKTVVVAGLNGGGKQIYALNVTTPDTFGASNVMWEFDTDNDANDLGYTYSRPQIGILESGEWVAIFGNGYNSVNGGAYLYVLDLATGALRAKIAASDQVGDESNGLSTPVLVDADDDKLIDAAYAGDLHGNLWKFNLASTATANVAYGQPLFRARYSATNQPITAQPKVADHPTAGQLVLFGTGRYITPSDVFDTSVQTYYGIWDNGAAITTTNRSELQQQSFDLQTGAFGRTVRSVTNNSVDWAGGRKGWYLDLLDSGTTAAGERVIHTSLVQRGRVIFGSIVPSTDPCSPGGRSWLIELKLGTGGAFNNSVLDLNRDGLFTSEDEVGGEIINAVSNDTLGISNVPVWIEDPNIGYKIRTGTTGAFATERNCLEENEELCDSSTPTTPGSVNRRSWIQIR